MWAQSWDHLSDILRPYPAKPDVDVTEEMVKQGWTAKKMFEKADEFFQSMGLDPMPAVRSYKLVGMTLALIG
jgi:peptidyl-dipeptidase A